MDRNEIINEVLSDLCPDTYTKDDFFEMWEESDRELFMKDLEKIVSAWSRKVLTPRKDNLGPLSNYILKIYILFDDPERFWAWFNMVLSEMKPINNQKDMKALIKKTINDYRKPSLSLIKGGKYEEA